MDDMRYLELHGDRVAYREAGDGEALLLIHGMAGSSATWRGVIPQLSKNYRVIAPDLLGHAWGLLPRLLCGLPAGPARRTRHRTRDGDRPVAGRRYRDAIRLPAPRSLRAAGADR
jgi:pimeloyl-ACP methyl ester carboxylesterase